MQGSETFLVADVVSQSLSSSGVYPNIFFKPLWKSYSGFTDLTGIICASYLLLCDDDLVV